MLLTSSQRNQENMENQAVKEKTCGNCRHFEDGDAYGKGWCKEQAWISIRDKVCSCFEQDLNGWEEITSDNIHHVSSAPTDRLIIAVIRSGKSFYMEFTEMLRSLSEMANLGGYYYYVLPELKITNHKTPIK